MPRECLRSDAGQKYTGGRNFFGLRIRYACLGTNPLGHATCCKQVGAKRGAANLFSKRKGESAMNKDQVKGRVDEAVGKVKEAVGKATGSTSTEVKGTAQKVAGKTQAAYGDAKEKVQKP